MFFEPCYPLIRGNVARIRNLTPTYDAISIQFPSFFFYFYALLRERERERSSLLSRIDRVSHSNSSVSSSPNLGGTNGNLAFCGSKSRSLNFLRSQTSIFPPLFRKSDASRGRSFEGIDKHWTRYTGCPKSNARFEL